MRDTLESTQREKYSPHKEENPQTGAGHTDPHYAQKMGERSAVSGVWVPWGESRVRRDAGDAWGYAIKALA